MRDVLREAVSKFLEDDLADRIRQDPALQPIVEEMDKRGWKLGDTLWYDVVSASSAEFDVSREDVEVDLRRGRNFMTQVSDVTFRHGEGRIVLDPPVRYTVWITDPASKIRQKFVKQLSHLCVDYEAFTFFFPISSQPPDWRPEGGSMPEDWYAG